MEESYDGPFLKTSIVSGIVKNNENIYLTLCFKFKRERFGPLYNLL